MEKDFFFEPDKFGPLRIWREPSPGAEYVVGVDVAEGITPDGARKGGDFSAAFVINATTLEHVATWHGHIDPYPFADEIAGLASYYNNALLAVEKNNHGLTVINRLVHELAYPNLYQQKFAPDKTKNRTKPRLEYGFTTTGSKQGGGSKALVVDALRMIVRRVTPIRDHRFCAEGLTWVLDERGRPKTNDGANDDVLMSAAIAYYVAHEAFGTAFMTRQPVQINAARAEYVERKNTWRRIIERTQEEAEQPDPWDEVPDEARQFYE